MKKLILIILTSLCIFSGGLSYAAESYTLIDLGTNGYEHSYAKSINNNEVIVGDFVVPAGETPKIFKWEDGVFSELPYSIDEIWLADANSINDLNEIVGAEYPYRPTATIWDHDGVITSIKTWAVAEDINNLSQVVCSTWEYNSTILWENGHWSEIVSQEHDGIYYSYPTAINDLGQVVGAGWLYDGEGYDAFAFLWEDGNVFNLNSVLYDYLSDFVYLDSASDINNLGQIIGELTVIWRGLPRPISISYLFDNGSIELLGFLGAKAINDNSQVVGSHYLYQDGELSNLYDIIETTIEYDELEVVDINNQGQIVGSALIDESTHAVLLNPSSDPTIPLTPPTLRIVPQN